MFVDLLLDLDDDLIAALRFRAVADGDSVEKIIRRAILTGAGEAYTPLAHDRTAVMRPMVALNLRRPM